MPHKYYGEYLGQPDPDDEDDDPTHVVVAYSLWEDGETSTEDAMMNLSDAVINSRIDPDSHSDSREER